LNDKWIFADPFILTAQVTIFFKALDVFHCPVIITGIILLNGISSDKELKIGNKFIIQMLQVDISNFAMLEQKCFDILFRRKIVFMLPFFKTVAS